MAMSIIGFMSMEAKQSYIFLAPGVEEIEAMATIDALRRADIPVVAVAVDTVLEIKGATGQTIVADSLIADIDVSDADWLIVPGGVPGAPNLHASKAVNDMWLRLYPGQGDEINEYGGEYVEEKVVKAPALITSEGPGTTLPFAIEIIRETKGDKTADDTAASMIITL